MFASRYIAQNICSPEFIKEKPDLGLGIIIVIPCYREPDVLQTLNSIVSCEMPACKVEVIIVVNQPEGDPSETSVFNCKTYSQIQEWKAENDRTNLRFFPVFPEPFPRKFAGAGMARKTGMDEAIRRFQFIDNPNGIVVSLDADTIVESNYLIEIEDHFNKNPNHVGATIRFKHRINPEAMDARQIEGVFLYEQYLHYYRKALAYTGYPFALFTIGSAFCCKAVAYVKQGGMNKKKAGEDFYFLHKLSQIGEVGEINSTCVHPSGRISDRVPFGTGPVLQRWVDGNEDLTRTYSFQAFSDLKLFFDRITELYKIEKDAFYQFIKEMPFPLQQFLEEVEFYNELQVVSNNAASPEAFRKRFYQVFNAFKVLKYINFSHSSFYNKQNIFEEINKMNAAIDN